MKSMVELSHAFLQPALHPQAIVADATLGNGHDTAFFLDHGVKKVIAFEIQEHIAKRTLEKIADPRLEVHLCGHENMDRFIVGNLDACIFNFGYCPGEDPSICTSVSTSLQAVKKALALLKNKGRCSLVFYPHASGLQEKETICEYLKTCRGLDILEIRRFDKASSPSLTLIEKRRSP